MARPDSSLACVCLLTLLCLGCGEAERVPRGENLLRGSTETLAGDRRMVLESQMGTIREIHCADRTRPAVTLKAGQEGSAVVVTGNRPQLVVSGCRPATTAGEERRQGVLLFTIASQDGHPREAELRIPRHGGWWRQRIDLAQLEGEVLRLGLQVRLPPGEELYLSEMVLEHEVPSPPPQRSGRQVLVVSLDTLRADAVMTPDPQELPTFARLAAEAERWTTHYAASSWTQPSHASLLTGQPLTVHGASDHPIHPAVTTVAERFRAAGFRTGGAVYHCVWLDKKFGFGRGFEGYVSGKWRLDTAVRHTLNWIGEHRGEDFFYFLHGFEPHSDFHRLPYEGGLDGAGVAALGFPDYGCREGRCASRLLRELGTGEIATLPGEEALLRRLYQGGVETSDAALGELIDGLRRLGVWENLLLVVTSDHGELLFEHGETLHGQFWEPGIRVPLFIKWPGGRGGGAVREHRSSALDIVPTLLTAFDLPLEGLPGMPLAERAEPRRQGAPVFLETAGWHAVITGPGAGLKLVEYPALGEVHLFDLGVDPDELHNLAASRPADTERLLQALHRNQERGTQLQESLEEGKGLGPAPDLTPEERRRLRSLGYL